MARGAEPTLNSTSTGERLELKPLGAWTTAQSEVLEECLTAMTPQALNARTLSINMSGIGELDTLGAWRWAAGTPIPADTHVGLEFQGLTGAPVITLEGRSKMPPPAPSNGLPVLRADPAAGVSMTQAARDALIRLQALLAENSEPLHNTLANLSTFSAALARNSDRVEGIITGVERLTGAGPAAAMPIVYDLTPPQEFPGIRKSPTGQLSIPEPSAVLMLDTQKILVRPSGVEGPTFSNAKWSDNVPKLLQARLMQSFEDADLLRSVLRPMDGLTANHQLLIDIRSFQLSLSADPQAEVEFSAKISR